MSDTPIPSKKRRSTGANTIRTSHLASSGGTTADRVVKILVEHIRKNRLPPRTPLPSEIQTSAQLKVSRGAVREAYRSLSHAGLVEIANGRSPRVGLMNNRSLLQFVQHALWTQQASADQILELRSPIEERAAELAALNRTDADVEELRKAVAGMKAAGWKAEPYVRHDITFHEVVGRASGNPLFRLLSSGLREAMGASIRISLAGRQSATELNNVIATHSKIVDAIAARRGKDARRLMERHFKEAATAVRRQAAREAAASVAPASVRTRRRGTPDPDIR